ncbi:MAG: hypothetical protein RIM80_16720 [Alphaproteobacteria bacterium]
MNIITTFGKTMPAPENLKAKRWNERLRLVITALNLTAVGTFGLAVTAPLLRSSGPILNGRSAITALESKLPGEFSPLDVVAWDAALAALAMHIFAHILVGLIEPEG